MRFEAFFFGSIRIDGLTYENDVVIDHGEIRKCNKEPSKKFRNCLGHIPLATEEAIPRKCATLVIGAGTGAMPAMDNVTHEAKRRKIKLLILSTQEAIEGLKK